MKHVRRLLLPTVFLLRLRMQMKSVLYEGEIVERGKHEELIELNGYKRLHDMQQL